MTAFLDRRLSQSLYIPHNIHYMERERKGERETERERERERGRGRERERQRGSIYCTITAPSPKHVSNQYPANIAGCMRLHASRKEEAVCHCFLSLLFFYTSLWSCSLFLCSLSLSLSP